MSSMRKQPSRTSRPMNILLTNGRFPVALDLARQLKLAGHHVFVVDPMRYHICKFSRDVKKTFQVPAPRSNAQGYLDGVKRVVEEEKIELIIPIHEEILYCADAAQTEEGLRDRLLAPPFATLVRLHSKWHFAKFLETHGLDAPYSVLCRSYDEVEKLDRSREWALKPVFGRASLNVFHLEPSKPLPHEGANSVQIDDENYYVAQEWLRGDRFCSYSVLQDGHVVALGVYPVQETIDGSSCVYFQSVRHDGILDYMERLAGILPRVSGQLAFDFVETKATPDAPSRLVAIECNPRSTAGLHLWAGTSDLALALTCRPSMSQPPSYIHESLARPGAKRQVAPGMLMWKRDKGTRTKLAVKQYLTHMKKITGSRDVVFSLRDIMPSLMEPFLLTSYYEICREQNLTLPTMFQHDLTWEPTGEYLRKIRRMLEDDSKRD